LATRFEVKRSRFEISFETFAIQFENDLNRGKSASYLRMQNICALDAV